MGLLLLLLLFASSLGWLVCPPLCVGSNSSSLFLVLSEDVSFRGVVLAAAPSSGSKRITGSSGEIEYIVSVEEVFKGGIFKKRNGKNVVHVFSGLSWEPGTECGVSLNLGQEYLIGGFAAKGSSAAATSRVAINQCTLLVPWSSVDSNGAFWLRSAVAPHFPGSCSLAVFPTLQPPACPACAATEFCMTNAINASATCGAPTGFCVPSIYKQTSPS